MREYKVGDKLTFHSDNGYDYQVIIENINNFRPDDMKYAVNIIDPNGISYYESYGDLYFCGDSFIDKCIWRNEYIEIIYGW